MFPSLLAATGRQVCGLFKNYVEVTLIYISNSLS